MQVNYAYRQPVSARRETWGNASIDILTSRVPALTGLVSALQQEEDWSVSGPDGASRWSALIFADFKSEPPRFVLQIQPSLASLSVPPLPIDIGEIPSLPQVERHVLRSLRRC